MNYYPHHIGDYLKDTAHLTMIEDGAYRRLLDLYYQHEQPLPVEKRQIYRLSRAASTAERKAVDIILSEYFALTDAGWTHRRCDAEIEKSREKSDKASKSAAKRWHKEGNANAHANASEPAMPTHSEGNAYPITNNQEPKEKEYLSSGTEGAEAARDGSKSPDEIPQADYLPSGTAYGLMAKLLRSRGVDVAAGNPHMRAWVDKGLTEDEALAGIEAARLAKPAPEAIPWAYLSKTLETLRTKASAVPDKAVQAAKPTQTDDRWWLNNAGIDRKGRELGLFARGGESYLDFKDRIFEALRRRDAAAQEQTA
ncbi:YdaU family protein [Bordetella avium]|uniref:YdaU family protein n=1 Tax=Bordetella avium TaxID=521 RepID=UPI00068EE156|nr:YdaU family protein [Bordetella avium]